MITFELIKSRYNLIFLPFEQDGYSLRFWHEPTATYFRYIPYGRFIYGLSSFDINLLPKPITELPISVSEMTPSQECISGNFFISESPICIDATSNTERKIIYENVSYFQRVCAQFGCELPTEHQIEFVLRKGSNGLFPFYFNFNDYDDFLLILDKEIRPWMNINRTVDNVNSLGISGIFFPLWTRTDFGSRKDLVSAKEDFAKNNIAVRSGSFEFWPWQAEEWTWCIPSHRFPSSELPDNKAAAFFVINAS